MKEKPLFKIWDTKNDEYVSGTKNKSTWTSIGWVTSKIEDLCRDMKNYGYSNRSGRNRKPDEFEVREFKLVLENTFDAGDLFREKEEIARIKKEGATRYGIAADAIRGIVPGLQARTIKEPI